MESNHNKLIKKFEEKFPEMIKKKQCVYVESLAKFLPNLIKELENKWEIKYKYDESGENIIFMCPISKKEDLL